MTNLLNLKVPTIPRSSELTNKCREICGDMVKAGIKSDAHAYNILAKGYIRAQELEKAEELLMAMIESRFHLNVVIFTTVISEWCSDGGVDRAI